MTRPLKRRLAWWLRNLGDRIDPTSGPRAIGRSFTIESGRGFMLHHDGRIGCQLWYMAEDYDQAFGVIR